LKLTHTRFHFFELYKELSNKSGSVQKNDLLVTGGGSIGIPYLIKTNEPLYFKDADLLWLKNGEKLNGYFLYTFFSTLSFRRYVNSITHIGTISHYTVVQAKSTPIDIPNKVEQDEIGEFLLNIDNLINLHQTKVNKLTNLKIAMLEKMFPKQGMDVPEIRFKGFSGAWEMKSLGDVADFSRGKGLSWSDIDPNGSYECVLYGHLYTDYGMVINEVKYFTNSLSNELVKSKFGDVLIPCSDTTPTGLARAISIEKSGVFLGGDINIIRPKSGLIGSFLSYNINANRNKLIKLIKGTTVRHLDNTDLKTVELYMPTDEKEQIKISQYFQRLDKTITLHQTELEKLNNMKKACLEKMFV